MKKFVAIAWLFAAWGVQAQNTISIEGNTLFSSVAEQIKPGTTVLFGPNATLIVTDGMKVQGTEEARVVFQSADQDAPGRGIVFQVTSSRGGSVSLEHVLFKQLEEAVYFESYTQYASIQLENVEVISSGKSGSTFSFYNMTSNGAKGSTDISLKDMRFIGNAGSVKFLGINDEVKSLSLQNILFAYNTYFGSEDELIQIEAFTSDQKEVLELDNLVFLNNYISPAHTPWTIELSGMRDTLAMADMFLSEEDLQSILDGRKDYNRSYLPVNALTELPEFASDMAGEFDFLYHGDTLISDALTAVENVEGPTGNRISYEKMGANKVLFYGLDGEEYVYLRLSDGRMLAVALPEALEPEQPANEPGSNMNQVVYRDYARAVADSLTELFMAGGGAGGNVQMVLDPILSYPRSELGFLLGTSYYIGDVNPGGVIPMTLEPCAGGMYNYLFDERWSVGVKYQYSAITSGIHAGIKVASPINSISFRNDMHSFSGEVLYALWGRKQGASVYGHLSGEGGVSLGLLLSNPKRLLTNEQKELVWTPLRDFGNEGQNIPGSGITPYGIAHAQGSIVGRLRWAKGKLCVFFEGNYTLSTSDYLDDVGYGYFFGGDQKAFTDAGGMLGLSDPGGDGRRAINQSIRNGGDGLIHRGTSAFPDAYVNFQLGFSYVLEKKKK
jgi:hypothetical protein